jgi:hypothetical protein
MSAETEQRGCQYSREIKFFVAPSKAERLQAWVRSQLAADPHGSGEQQDTYRVTSVYFDTPRFDVYRRQGSFSRSKYRIRRYDAAESVYLERKTKTKNLVSKRRCRVELTLLSRLETAEVDARWPGYWFHRRLLGRELKPVCRISYERLARIGLSDFGPVRLTLDRNLRAWRADGSSFEVHADGLALPDDPVILELKYSRGLPGVFKRLIQEFGPAPQRISKYRLAIPLLGLASESREPIRV